MQKNIFSVLNQNDSEGETEQQPQAQLSGEKQKRDRKKGQGKKNDEPEVVLQKENNQRNQDAPRTKGVSDQPHPQDRHSGAAHPSELRKDGGGRGNVGKYQDDLKLDNRQSKEEESPSEVTKAPVVVVPEVPQSTLEEYYKELGVDLATQGKKQKPEYVRKIDEADLKKDKLSVLKTKEDLRKEQEATSKKVTVHKLTAQDGYNKQNITQGSEFLKFSTGKVEDAPVKQSDDQKPRYQKNYDNKEGGERKRYNNDREDGGNKEGGERKRYNNDREDGGNKEGGERKQYNNDRQEGGQRKQYNDRQQDGQQDRGQYRVKGEGVEGEQTTEGQAQRGGYKGNREDRGDRGAYRGNRGNYRGGDRQDRGPRAPREDRGDKQEGGDRQQERGERQQERGDRQEGGERQQERVERNQERGERQAEGQVREDRPQQERDNRPKGDRQERSDRNQGDRNQERGDRQVDGQERENRPQQDRDNRPKGDRQERGDNRQGDRKQAGGNRGGDRVQGRKQEDRAFKANQDDFPAL